jgi:hypothetical protein
LLWHDLKEMLWLLCGSMVFSRWAWLGDRDSYGVSVFFEEEEVLEDDDDLRAASPELRVMMNVR